MLAAKDKRFGIVRFGVVKHEILIFLEFLFWNEPFFDYKRTKFLISQQQQALVVNESSEDDDDY